MYVYARLRTRAHKSAAKLQKKIDIHKSVCHFSSIFNDFSFFRGILTPMTGMDGVHERVEIRAEREDIAEAVVVLRIFAVIVGKGQKSQTAVVEGEHTRHASQIVHTEMAEHDA